MFLKIIHRLYVTIYIAEKLYSFSVNYRVDFAFDASEYVWPPMLYCMFQVGPLGASFARQYSTGLPCGETCERTVNLW